MNNTIALCIYSKRKLCMISTFETKINFKTNFKFIQLTFYYFFLNLKFKLQGVFLFLHLIKFSIRFI
jgi:hypothetical protein